MRLHRAPLAVPVLLFALQGCGGDAGDSGTSGEQSTAGAGASGSGAAQGSGGGGAAAASGAGGGAGSTGSGPGPIDCDDRPAAPPSTAWANATGNLAGHPSECGNLTLVSATPCSTRVLAGVAQHGLWASDDGGKTWEQLGTGPGSAEITNRPSAIVYDPEHPGTFWESGIYNGGGVYKTTDAGTTFEQLGSVTHCDLVSVDFGDPARKTLVAGGHEQKQTLHRSTDGGQNWTNVGMNLPATSHFSSLPLVVDAKTHLLGSCGWGDGECGIWRTADGGGSWTRVSELPAQAAPLWASDGAIYWAVSSNGGIAASPDQGQTWTEASSGGLATATPIELSSGRIVAVGSDHLMISSDGAKTWKPIGEPLPFAPSGVAWSALTQTFFVWHWDCGDVVLPDAIMSAGFDDSAG